MVTEFESNTGRKDKGPTGSGAQGGSLEQPNEKWEGPLAERMRPRDLGDLVGQDHIVGEGSPLRRALESGRIFSVIFWGPPGSGKTTLARLMADYTRFPFRSFSAVTSGIKDLRKVTDEAEKTFEGSGKPTILFVDEIHRFNKAQQDAFLPYVEKGLIILVGATTENPSFEVIPPLLSRARVMVLHPLGEDALRAILERALQDEKSGLGKTGVRILPEALDHLIHVSSGDARVALNNLEMAVQYVLAAGNSEPLLDLQTVEKALDRKALPYDKAGEEHYNLISAFHKSLRGSDPQASLYWLYRMLEAGEDPLFIARRMIRMASEDVGLADPQALPIALAAFDAWRKVGPPEAELALAEAAVYLASAPKSNALYLAERAVKAEIRESGALPVPLHIRNAPTRLMKRLGYSRGYLYPHNYPGAWIPQEYLPKGIKTRTFYRPTNRGHEREILRLISERKKRVKGKPSPRAG
ncbi:MAG: replication-associated recombination protein A [Deltaproteobacteria bacterium]|nr:replication-associated recombination protein A [Deltaproteobacteria bacterium]MBW2016287.1 replication-associated recombination protein A [Deltaproteobacteria bacterium]MBW2129036.1 replication-associated recombination protein A [Deltaproteobacteria bacterium]